MVLIDMNDAADRLGVSVRHVQRLAKSGHLDRVAANRLELESVLRFERSKAGHHRQAWSETTAWAAIALLTGAEAGWLGQSQRSRVKARLRTMSAQEYVGSTRNRATVHRFAAHGAALRRMAPQIVESGTNQPLSGLTAETDSRLDGYIDSADLDRLVETYRLSSDGGGEAEIVLRTTAMDLDVVRGIVEASQILAATDLATSLDVRDRRTGLDYITKRLGQFS